ncbi:MAG: MFS transporter [Bacteroidetes bacterium]|nr:MFS transporter [Bacteroidota bacterium]
MKELPKDFWLLCVSTLLFTLSFNVILPELNTFLESIGEGENKWAVLVPWTISAMLLRPLSGKMADVVGRKFVIVFGTLVSILAAFFYPLAAFLAFFFMLRFFHGFCAGFQPTGASALAADLIPEKIRGEAMGFFSISISLGFGIGQALSSPLKQLLGMDGLFYSVAVFGLLSLVLIFPVKETKHRRKDFRISDIIPRPAEIIAPEVFVPATVMFLITICTGFYMLLIPDITTHLGIENKGLFFFTHMVSSLVVRYLAGRLSDRIGRRKSTVLGLAVFALATLLMTVVNDRSLFLFCGFIYGVGTGIISPTIMAWTTDLSHPEKKGRGLATMWMGLEFGLMIGAFGGMYLYGNDPNQFPLIFGIAAVILITIIIYLLTVGRRMREHYAGPETDHREFN